MQKYILRVQILRIFRDGQAPVHRHPTVMPLARVVPFLIENPKHHQEVFCLLEEKHWDPYKGSNHKNLQLCLEYCLGDNFLKFTIHIACHVDNVLTVNQKLDFVGKEEEKWLIPGRSMLSILTDANLRDSANAGGGD